MRITENQSKLDRDMS